MQYCYNVYCRFYSRHRLNITRVLNIFSLNLLFNCIFIAEMSFKIYAYGPLGYIRDRMNQFDGIIVSLTIIDMGKNLIKAFSSSGNFQAFKSFRILRTLRVLRITKILRALPFMKVIINVISNCLTSFLNICNFYILGLLTLIIIFIFALLGMQIFGGNFV